MPNFTVSAQVTVSCWTEVEADSEKEAIEIAQQRSLGEPIFDGGHPPDECWNFTNDGEPEGISAKRS